MEKLENIVFDQEDKELFLVDDLPLKADAIRNSILPKLELLMNYAVTQIDKVYDINVFDESMIAKAPGFRLRHRKSETKMNYEYANVKIKGIQGYGKWHGIKKPDGQEPMIAPYTLGIELREEGMVIFVDNHEHYVSKEANRKIVNFLIKHDPIISVMQQNARVFLDGPEKEEWGLITSKDWLKIKFDDDDFRFIMLSDFMPYPLNISHFNSIIDRLTLLYPIYHCYDQIGKGQRPTFEKLVEKANEWLLEEGPEAEVTKNKAVNAHNIELIRSKAASKIKVMPGIRWQVFKRDSWRCVACGRNSEDEIILHVDHILPRSKGGKDELKNFQTLCNICNIGKSNKDETDLRKGNIAK